MGLAENAAKRTDGNLGFFGHNCRINGFVKSSNKLDVTAPFG